MDSLITYGELHRWLLSENGEYLIVGEPEHYGASMVYNADDAPVSGILIRRPSETQWHEPTREYMGLEVSKDEV